MAATTSLDRIAPSQVPDEPWEPAALPSHRRRRWPLLFATTVTAAVWVVAAMPAQPSNLMVRTDEGLAVVDPVDGTTITKVGDGAASSDGSVLATARFGGVNTEVAVVSAATGSTVWSREVAGRYVVRLVGHDGEAVVLAPTSEDGYVPQARTATTLLLVRPDDERTYTLFGNFEPEALSLDNDSLFLVKYTPPMDPEWYQVRRLDLATGKVGDVFTPDEDLQDEMGGAARTQTASADGRRLYTLYTLAAPDGPPKVFVHVLALDDLWAHCIDLDASFIGSADSRMSVSPDGSRLYVADGAAARIGQIDTKTLRVVRTTNGPRTPPDTALVTSTDASGGLLVGAGTQLMAYDRTTLRPTGTFAAPGVISAVQGARDGTAYIGVKGRILLVDPVAERVLHTSPYRRPVPINALGPAPPSLADPRHVLDCAC